MFSRCAEQRISKCIKLPLKASCGNNITMVDFNRCVGLVMRVHRFTLVGHALFIRFGRITEKRGIQPAEVYSVLF
jgi:hypothetical protein